MTSIDERHRALCRVVRDAGERALGFWKDRGALTIEYHPKSAVIELGFLNFADADPTTTKLLRYTLVAAGGPSGSWQRLDDGGELIDDVRRTLLKLYPELGQSEG